MRCPQCGSEQPLWAKHCMQCGAPQFRVPAPTPAGQVPLPPPATAPPGPVPAPAQPPVPPPPAEPKDYRPHITAGYLLALVSTLVLPPLFGPLAMWLGYVVYTKGAGDQRKQGLLVIAAGLVGTAIGMAVALWIDAADLLA